jgi:UTP--glucose-1-phosphate uridylyltransferase
MGRYILQPRIFPLLEETTPGAGGEIQLTDALRLLVREQPLYGYVFRGRRYDVGSKLGYLKATVEFALEREDLRQEFLAYLASIVAPVRAG